MSKKIIVFLLSFSLLFPFPFFPAFAVSSHTWNTEDEFSTGTVSNTSIAQSTGDITLGHLPGSVIDGGEVLLGQSWKYGTSSIPAIGSNDVYHFFLDSSTHLLYVSTGAGVSVIDTKNTDSMSDDEILITYNEDSTPALLTDDLQGGEFHESFLDPTTDYLYMVKGWSTDFSKNGLQVVDTKGTKTVSDDTFVTSYTRSGSVARLTEDEDVMGCDMDYVAGVIYCVGNDSSRFSVIDTKKTKDPADDTSLSYRVDGVYNTTNGVNSLASSTPKVAPLNGQNDLSFDSENHILYVTGQDGLFSLHTQGTISPVDDISYFYTPSGIFETTNSSAGLLVSASVFLSGTANRVSFFGDLLYVSTWGGGLSVIDTKGTITPIDDELVVTYTTATTPAIGNNYVRRSSLQNDLLYVSTNSGLSVIDTKGTTDSADDTLVTTYTTTSTPAIGNNSTTHSFLDSFTRLLYVSTYSGGLSVIDLDEEYASPASYQSSVKKISDTPTDLLSFSRTQSDDQSTAIRYRTGDSGAVFFNDFDDDSTSEYLGDFYAWGNPFNDAVESGGTMRLSDPTPYAAGDRRDVYFWLDTGKPDGYFPIGSVVTARVRVNSDREQPTDGSMDWMYNDDWWDDSDGSFLPNN
nr:hypothetical protein [Candidatus Moranbacteria bacterium]